jgi:DNA-binding Lrp family transcriptional regulator
MDAAKASDIMNDEYAARILVWASDRPWTAAEMSDGLGIPISACYNRIRMLEEIGLLRRGDMRVSPSGKQIASYQSLLKRGTVVLDRGAVRIRLELSDGRTEELTLVQEGCAIV